MTLNRWVGGSAYYKVCVRGCERARMTSTTTKKAGLSACHATNSSSQRTPRMVSCSETLGNVAIRWSELPLTDAVRGGRHRNPTIVHTPGCGTIYLERTRVPANPDIKRFSSTLEI